MFGGREIRWCGEERGQLLWEVERRKLHVMTEEIPGNEAGERVEPVFRQGKKMGGGH